jgi:hypothetical protein
MYRNIREINIGVNKNHLSVGKLKEIFINNCGNIPVLFNFNNPKFKGLKIKTAEQFYLQVNECVLNEISSLVGEGNLLLTL